MNIHDLVLIGDPKALEEFLNSHPNPAKIANERGGRRKESPLFTALRQSNLNLNIIRLLLESGADPNEVKFEDYGDSCYQEFALALMFDHGSLELLQLFDDHGANWGVVTQDGCTAVYWATIAETNSEVVVPYLLQKGCSPNTPTTYNELPILEALRRGLFGLLKIFVAAGAEEPKGLWTPLIKVCAIGALEDLQRVLAETDDLDAKDATGHSALDVALRRGHREIVDALLGAGASLAVDTKGRRDSLGNAISSGKLDLVRLVLDKLAEVDSKESHFDSALSSAVAYDNSEVVRMLIDERGASFGQEALDTALDDAESRDVILMLLQVGANPAKLSTFGRRVLVGLPQRSEVPLTTISEDQYREMAYVREGRSNPDEMTDPFRLAMIQAGVDAYSSRLRFNDPPNFAYELTATGGPDLVWCFDRRGQSFTLLPDGRMILIAGENEDGYDPDFCIFNDVTVFSPDGRIQVFGYPYSLFEPTAFHTATLVGDYIWMIGGLGYRHQGSEYISVYRLDTRDYSIEKIETFGDAPPRFYNHRAFPVGESEILCQVPSRMLRQAERKEPHLLRLNTLTRTWASSKEA